MTYTYQTDGAAIYAESFATIRAEADLTRFAADEEQVAVRLDVDGQAPLVTVRERNADRVPETLSQPTTASRTLILVRVLEVP